MDASLSSRWKYRGRFVLKWLGVGVLSLLLMLLAGGLVLAVFLAFENWRGHRAWEKFTAECEAAGESLRPEAVIPPPVPDEENFAAIPLFAPIWNYTIDHDSKEDLPNVVFADLEKLRQLIYVRERLFPMPDYLSEWQQGKLFDAAKMQASFPSGMEVRWPTGYHTAEDILTALSAVEDDLAQLRASVDRPKCQGIDHVPEYPHAREVSSDRFFASVQGFAEIASLKSLASLSAGDSGAAAEDLLLVLKLIRHLRSIEVVEWIRKDWLHEMAIGVIWDGLARHAWSEGQLKQLDDELAWIDRIADCQTMIRSARNLHQIPGLERLGQFYPLAMIVGLDSKLHELQLPFNAGLPQGIRRLYEIPVVRSINRFIPPMVDVEQRTFRVSDIKQLNTTLESLDENGAAGKRIDSKPLFVVCSCVFDPFLYPFGSKRSLEQHIRDIRLGYENQILRGLEGYDDFLKGKARTQSIVDLARVAIALERHRLRHGEFPESLNALDTDVRPDGGIPHDVINGEPLRYHRTDDGRFQLYSVGWNQSDDGGTLGWDGAANGLPDRTQGDWVWPQPTGSP